jgi:fructose-specific phosphotransferase system IIC component
VTGCILAGYLVAILAGAAAPISSVALQSLAAILVYPLVARLCARLDVWRLR